LAYLDYQYPPLFYIIGSLLKNLVGNYRIIFISPSLFFVLLIICVYGIGKTLANKKTGIMAAYICSFFPFIYKTSVQFNLELATAALSCLVILIIFNSGKINRFAYCTMLSAAVIAAGLTRQLIFLFVIGPLIYHLIIRKKEDELIWRKSIFDIVVSFAVSIIILLLCYYWDINTFAALISKADKKGLMPPSALNSAVFHAFYYLRAIPIQINWFYFLFFIFAVLMLIAEKSYFKYFFLSWFIPPILVLSLVYNKFPEFTIANLPAIALAIAWAIDAVKNIKIKKAFEFTAVVIGMCLYFKTF